MTARPIRRNAQTPDRNGKIFYTSTTSLSHISKIAGIETASGVGTYTATFNLEKGIAIALVFLGVYIVTQSKSRKDFEKEGKEV